MWSLQPAAYFALAFIHPPRAAELESKVRRSSLIQSEGTGGGNRQCSILNLYYEGGKIIENGGRRQRGARQGPLPEWPLVWPQEGVLRWWVALWGCFKVKSSRSRGFYQRTYYCAYIAMWSRFVLIHRKNLLGAMGNKKLGSPLSNHRLVLPSKNLVDLRGPLRLYSIHSWPNPPSLGFILTSKLRPGVK